MLNGCGGGAETPNEPVPGGTAGKAGYRTWLVVSCLIALSTQGTDPRSPMFTGFLPINTICGQGHSRPATGRGRPVGMESG